MDHSEALRALDRETARSLRALRIERAFATSRWALLAVAVWLALSLLGMHEAAPPLLATILTAAALALFLSLFWSARGRYVEPKAAEARERLSRNTGFDPAFAAMLEDRPAQLDPVGLALWRREQARAAVRLDEPGARANARIKVDRADPFRLRFAIPAMLACCVLVAGPDAGDRLARAFVPDPGPLVGDGPMRIEAWATPAAYTGARPVSLTDRLDETVETPPSPTITVRLTGPAAAPRLIVKTGAGRQEIRFERAADGAFEAHAEIESSARIEIVRFFTKARWRITPTRDLAPNVRFTTAPTVDRTTLSVAWSATDDFGLQQLLLRLTPVAPRAGLTHSPALEVPLEVPAGEPRAAEGRAEVDLARHPYAGLEVYAQIVGVDAAGLEGASLPARLTAPEATFLQPLARAAIEIRKLILHERRPYAAATTAAVRIDGLGRRVLAADDRLRRAPAAIRRAGDMLDSLSMAPEDGYFEDLVVYGGLRLARSLLDVAREIEETDAAADVLWNVAARAEHGASADARRALETAQSQLSRALRRGANEQEIAALSQTLQKAMGDYLQSLAREALQNGQPGADADDVQESGQSLGTEDLEQMLADIQEQAAQGDHAGAERMLQAFAQMLGDLEVRLTEGAPRSGDGESEPTALEQALESLVGQIGAQRALRDQTTGGSHPDTDDLAERQGALAEAVRETQRNARAGGVEAGLDELQDGREAMRRAQEHLEQGDADAAAQQQDLALRSLRKASDNIAAGARGEGEGEQGDLDPLGRSLGGPGQTNAAVPSEIDRQRAREILDELRRRAQDVTRPEAERDYLRRLLERFTES